MKGPEVAAHYPVPSDRPFGDLDLLVEDPEAAQRALIAAGFVEFGEPDGIRRPSAPSATHVAGRSSGD